MIVLQRRSRVCGVEVAWDRIGSGPPVVLVHGFPSNSALWRNVVPTLARTRSVYLYDVPGQGLSERRPGMDVSDPFQARVLASLLAAWGLERPAIVLHDIGATYGMTAALLEGQRFERIALLSAAMLVRCVTAATLHAKRYLEAYQTMPVGLYETIAAARIRSTTFKPMAPEAFAAYFEPWRGELGQALWYNRVAQIEEAHTARLEAALGPMPCPVRIVWGSEDTWIPVSQAGRLGGLLGSADIRIVPQAGHFVMDDDPAAVTGLLDEFLRP